jgi:hypothetical protein
MIALKWLGIALAAGAYLTGLARWIYAGKVLPGLLAMLVLFPALIWLTYSSPLLFLRALPLAGLAMFAHRYGARILLEMRLLWFTTLSVLAVQAYYLVAVYLYN